MNSTGIEQLLTEDARFTKGSFQLSQRCSELFENIISDAQGLHILANKQAAERVVRYLNLLLLGADRNDSIVTTCITSELFVDILFGKNLYQMFDHISNLDLKEHLGDKYVESSYVDFDVVVGQDTYAPTSNPLDIVQSTISEQVPDEVVNNSIPLSDTYRETVPKPEFLEKLAIEGYTVLQDPKYWAEAVALDWPLFPLADFNNIVYKHHTEIRDYVIYGETMNPWNQSQISVVSDVNRFSDQDILNLFPPFRLYTRSQYMYKKYDGLDYDDDLGVIFKIKGFTKKQITKNIFEYPHLDCLDRHVKIHGKDTTIPFWKHIEIDGEMCLTSAVWDKLSDTKHLPKTESFMREYVVRRYILEETVKGVDHKYKMRQDLRPFITLYAPPDYYSQKKLDPIEIGRECVKARIALAKSTNPILRMIRESNAEMSVQ